MDKSVDRNLKKEKYYDLLEESAIDFEKTKSTIAAKNIALSYYYLEAFDRALKKLEWARSLTTIDTDIYMQLTEYLGAAYGKKGCYDDAIQCFNELIKTDNIKCNFRGKMGKGIVLTRIGKLRRDDSFFDEALKVFFDSLNSELSEDEVAALHSNIGETYQAKEEHEKAIKFYEKSLKVSRDKWRADTLNSYAVSLACLGRFTEAYKSLVESYEISISKNNETSLSDNFKSYGIVYKLEGKIELAYDYLKRARSIAKDKNLLYELAEVCYMLGDMEKDKEKAAFYKAEHDLSLQMIEEEVCV